MVPTPSSIDCQHQDGQLYSIVSLFVKCCFLYLVFFASPSPQLEVYLRRRRLKEGGVTLCSIQHLVRTRCCSAPLLGRLAPCAPVEHRRRSAATPTARVYAVLISSGPARPHSMLCFHRIHYIPDSCLFCSAVLVFICQPFGRVLIL